MHKRKKIVMLLTRNPYPIDNGAKLKISQTIAFLKDKFELFVFIFSKEPIDKNIFYAHGVFSIEKLSFPSKIELMKNLVTMKKYSLQERFFYSYKNKNLILKKIDDIEPDLIYADMIRTAQYIEYSNFNKVVDIEDLLSIRYERFLHIKENSILGTFEYLIPSLFRRPIEALFKNLILKHEINLISKREAAIVKFFDASFLISNNEKDYLRIKTGLNTIYTNTLTVPIRTNCYNKNNQSNNLLFIGNMSTAQNLSTLKMIIEEILPYLTFNYKLIVIGKYDGRTEKLVVNNKNIELLGFVDDMKVVLKDIKLALMPISFGTGIKTKILDCMSYGIPVLTNDIGNEGLNTVDMHDIILVDTLQGIPSTLKKVLKDEELLEKVSCNGYKYVNSNHNFEELKIKFNNHIENILYQTKQKGK